MMAAIFFGANTSVAKGDFTSATVEEERSGAGPQRLPVMLSHHVVSSQLSEANYEGGTMAGCGTIA